MAETLTIDGIELPRTRSLEVGGSAEVIEATMASGKIVQDVIGWRVKLTAEWEYMPVGIFNQIVSISRRGGFVEIKYPDPVSGTLTAMFSIDIGNQKIFKFVSGSPYWYNISLTATAQEVVPYAAG